MILTEDHIKAGSFRPPSNHGMPPAFWDWLCSFETNPSGSHIRTYLDMSQEQTVASYVWRRPSGYWTGMDGAPITLRWADIVETWESTQTKVKHRFPSGLEVEVSAWVAEQLKGKTA